MQNLNYYFEGLNLSQHDLRFIETNTHLKKNKIIDYYTKFLAKYPNGFINEIEFKNFLKTLFNKESNEKIVKFEEDICARIFQLCDNDLNGFIDFKEYLVLFWCRANGDLYEKLEFIFKLFDSDNNGSLDFYELHSIVRILYKLKENELQSITNNINYRYNNNDKNGQLTPSYYITFSIMKKFDTNRNGILTKDEFIQGCLDNPSIRKFLTPLSVLDSQ